MCLLAAAVALPGAAGAQTLSFYGLPGIVDMPTAEVLPDGHLGLTSSYFEGTLRNTLTFQIFPRVTGTFRYSTIDDFLRQGRLDLFDRSFDIHVQLLREEGWRPSLAFGLRDFGGTGIFSSEYIVATKTFGPVQVTGGLGFGRLGGRDGFESPFAFIDDRFTNRPAATEGSIEGTGQFDADVWFRGDAALFGGVTWRPNDRWTIAAEYSSDLYTEEAARGLVEIDSPLNFGASYRFRNGVELGGYYLFGTEAGVRLSYVLDPATPRIPGGLEPGPPALQPRNLVAAASWNTGDGSALPGILARGLDAEGLVMEGYVPRGRSAEVRIRNERWGSNAQAAGRAARVLANTMPGGVDSFDIVLVRQGVPVTTLQVNRADLEELDHEVDGAWTMLARTRMSDAAGRDRTGETAGLYPAFDYALSPYITTSLFDPEVPLRYDVGVQLAASFSPMPGLIFAGRLRQPLEGNLADQNVPNDSVLPRVRSDVQLYAQESDLELSYLTAEYFFRPAPDLFGRVTAGYLENMYGGVSTELLWYPVDSQLALGAELNYAVQREFDMLFDFRDYEVWTGHVSAYYDFGNGFLGQVDAGRYLAGDWGATVGLDREFNNGFKVGAFFTLTDVPFEDFGEGSFDKGIRFEVPTSWFTGLPSQDTVGRTIRPVLRDGGARLGVRNRLYPLTRDARGVEISDEFGRFFR